MDERKSEDDNHNDDDVGLEQGQLIQSPRDRYS